MDNNSAPHSKETEQKLLAGLFYKSIALQEIDDILNEKDFYLERHRVLYGAIVNFAKIKKDFDVTMFINYLRDNSLLKQTGDVNYLKELVSENVGTVNIRHYAEEIRELSLRRQLQQVGGNLINQAFQPKDSNAHSLIESAYKDLENIANKGTTANDLHDRKKIVEDTLDDLNERRKLNPNELSGLDTGISYLNNLTDGLQPSHMIVLAGRPGLGKTSFATKIIQESLKKSLDEPAEERRGIVLFSLEMTSMEIMKRMLASESGVPLKYMHRADFSKNHFDRLKQASKEFNETPLFINDATSLNPSGIKQSCREVINRLPSGKIGLIVLDYMQLMKSDQSTSEQNRQQEVSDISRSLKAIAREFECPLIAVAQLNRNVEKLKSKHQEPSMSDLRDSGAIEQDADMIWLIYKYNFAAERQNMENPADGGAENAHGDNTPVSMISEPTNPDHTAINIQIAKNRHGPTGLFQMIFRKDINQFVHPNDAASPIVTANLSNPPTPETSVRRMVT